MRVRGDAQQDRCSRGQRSSSIWRLTRSGAGHRPGGYIRRRRANVRDGSASGTLKLRNLSSELGPTSEDDDASRDCDFHQPRQRQPHSSSDCMQRRLVRTASVYPVSIPVFRCLVSSCSLSARKHRSLSVGKCSEPSRRFRKAGPDGLPRASDSTSHRNAMCDLASASVCRYQHVP